MQPQEEVVHTTISQEPLPMSTLQGTSNQPNDNQQVRFSTRMTKEAQQAVTKGVTLMIDPEGKVPLMLM